MEALNICTLLDKSNTIPVEDGIIGAFVSNSITKEQRVAHCEVIWEDTKESKTKKYFTIMLTPVINSDLNDEMSNNCKNNHIVMGSQI